MPGQNHTIIKQRSAAAFITVNRPMTVTVIFTFRLCSLKQSLRHHPACPMYYKTAATRTPLPLRNQQKDFDVSCYTQPQIFGTGLSTNTLLCFSAAEKPALVLTRLPIFLRQKCVGRAQPLPLASVHFLCPEGLFSIRRCFSKPSATETCTDFGNPAAVNHSD